jgi:cytidyltransferase-like protein
LNVVVSGSFDNMHARQMRFLEEAAKLGAVHLLLWPDALVQAVTGQPPKFPQEERRYFVEAIRYVDAVTLADGMRSAHEPAWPAGLQPGMWVDEEQDAHETRRAICAERGMQYRIIRTEELSGFPPAPPMDRTRRAGRKKVLVTGCYDWLHSGHVRFFEEAAAFGELYVVVGNDANVRNLKGEGHPLFPEDLRRYMAGSIRYVHQSLITSGWGWMDAEPEIEQLKPDIYLVNEDGDKPEKRAFCAQHGLEYVVLKRLPKPGLQRRSSTDLRGY